MGNYSTLRINELEIYSLKREVDPTVMMLFTEQDKRVLPFHSSGSSASLPKVDTHAVSASNVQDEWENPEYIVEYAVPLSVAKDRLEFMGFTTSKIRKLFRDGAAERIAEIAERVNNPSWANNEFLHQSYSRKSKFYEISAMRSGLQNLQPLFGQVSNLTTIIGIGIKELMNSPSCSDT